MKILSFPDGYVKNANPECFTLPIPVFMDNE